METASAKGDDVVGQLPLEIWYHIFELCLPCFAERDRYSYVNVPWDLSQVSREWRRIVQSCPPLWSKINIHFGNLHPRKGYGIYDEAMFIGRRLKMQLVVFSKACPVDIIANCNYNNTLMYWINPSPLWLQLIPHLHRARMLSVHDSMTYDFFRSARASLPAPVDFLHLQLLHWDVYGGLPYPNFNLIGIPPRLHHVCLKGRLWEVATESPYKVLPTFLQVLPLDDTTSIKLKTTPLFRPQPSLPEHPLTSGRIPMVISIDS